MTVEYNPTQRFVRSYKDLLLPSCRLFGSRDEFKAFRGVEPPAYDYTKRTKLWVLNDLSGVVSATFTAKILVADPDTGQLILDEKGFPFLSPYSFLVSQATQVNIYQGVAGEKRFPGPETYLPLRDLQPWESLVLPSQLPREAGLDQLMNKESAYILDARYKPVVSTPASKSIDAHFAEVIERLVRIEKLLSPVV